MLKSNLNYYFDVEEFEQLVEYYMDMEHNGKALKAIRYAFQLHPDSIHLMIKKAQIHLRNKNPERALNALEKVENIESTNSDVYLTKGHSLLLLGNLAECQDYFDKALNLVDDTEEMLDVLQNISQTLQFSDLYKEAIKYLLKAFELDKENLMVLYDLAYCYDRAGNPEKSIVYYNHYINVEPYSEHVWFSLGNLYNKVGEIDQAIEAYEMAVAINPEYIDSIYELAVILEDNDQYSKAIRYYKQYLSFDPESAEIYLFIGNCYFYLNEYEEALEYYRKSMNVEDNNPEVYYSIANLLCKKQKYWDALFYAKGATYLDESDSRYHVLYGKINARLKMHKEAARAFYQTVVLKPEVFFHWILLTDELIIERKYDKAIRYLLDSMEFHGNNAMILFRLAALYYKINQMRNALKYFKKGMLMDKERYNEFFKICPEAKRSNEIKKVMQDKTL
ncbi:MAG: tetratricopeptide repeat protein [Bacteroidales bacterium]